MKTPNKEPCPGEKKDGTNCQAALMAGSRSCYYHDPSKADERRKAQSKGGCANRMKTLPAGTSDVRMESGSDVVRLLSETINQVRRGEIEPRVANAVGYLANILRGAISQQDLEKRISGLESLVKNRTAAVPGTLEDS